MMIFDFITLYENAYLHWIINKTQFHDLFQQLTIFRCSSFLRPKLKKKKNVFVLCFKRYLYPKRSYRNLERTFLWIKMYITGFLARASCLCSMLNLLLFGKRSKIAFITIALSNSIIRFINSMHISPNANKLLRKYIQTYLY